MDSVREVLGMSIGRRPGFAADRESEILHQMISNKNKSKRRLFLIMLLHTGNPHFI